MNSKQFGACYLYAKGKTVEQIAERMNEPLCKVEQLLAKNKYDSVLDIPCFRIDGKYFSANEIKPLLEGVSNALLNGAVNKLIRERVKASTTEQVNAWRVGMQRYAHMEHKSDAAWEMLIDGKTRYSKEPVKAKPKKREVVKKIENYGVPKLVRLA